MSVISTHFFDQVQIFFFLCTALLLRLDSKPTVNSRTYRYFDWIRKRIIIIIVIKMMYKFSEGD